MKKIVGSNKKIFLVFCIPFFLNLGFLLTDYLAGKTVILKSIFYSPVDNEHWLEFWAIFLSTAVTFCLLLHYSRELKFNKKKLIYEHEIENLKKEKDIVLEYLNEIELNDIAEIILIFEIFISKEFIKKEVENSIQDILNKEREKIKKSNFLQLKLDLTNLRIKSDKIEKENEELEKFREIAYDKLTFLREVYMNYFKEISKCMIEFLQKINEKDEIRRENFDKLLNDININFNNSYEKYLKNKKSNGGEMELIDKSIEIINSIFKEAMDDFQKYYICRVQKNNENL